MAAIEHPDTDQRINNVMHVMLEMFAKQGQHIDRRFDAVDRRFDAVDRRLDGIEKVLSEIKESVNAKRP